MPLALLRATREPTRVLAPEELAGICLQKEALISHIKISKRNNCEKLETAIFQYYHCCRSLLTFKMHRWHSAANPVASCRISRSLAAISGRRASTVQRIFHFAGQVYGRNDRMARFREGRGGEDQRAPMNYGPRWLPVASRKRRSPARSDDRPFHMRVRGGRGQVERGVRTRARFQWKVMNIRSPSVEVACHS